MGSARAERGPEVGLELLEVGPVCAPCAARQAARAQDRRPERLELPLAMLAHEMLDEAVGLEIGQRRRLRLETAEARHGERRQRKERPCPARADEREALAMREVASAERTRLEPLCDAFVHPGGQPDARRLGVEG